MNPSSTGEIKLTPVVSAASYNDTRIEDVLLRLKSEICKRVRSSMISSLGFTDEDIDEYLPDFYVDVTNDDHTYVRIEVRAEVGYESLEVLMEDLNRYISKLDQDAYFDAVDVGITECYINYKKVAAALGRQLRLK